MFTSISIVVSVSVVVAVTRESFYKPTVALRRPT
jgi:hypothetical protein